MAGMKVITATSGPGISLFSEQISFAIASETPIVIVDVQRLGPSTGSATKGADGDIQFLRWGNSGGLPVIVLAPVDVKDCLVLTRHAFNLAETYRCPVFIAVNKEIAMTKEAVDLEALAFPENVDRRPLDKDKPYLPFEVEAGHLTPAFSPIGGEPLMRVTSSTHGPDAYITGDPEITGRMQERRFQKVNSAVELFSYYDALTVDGADTLVIAYGVTARAARVAVKASTEARRPASLLILKTLWPVCEGLIRRMIEPYGRIVVVEMNLGQYVREIERLSAGKQIRFLGRMNGELIKPSQIQEMIENG